MARALSLKAKAEACLRMPFTGLIMVMLAGCLFQSEKPPRDESAGLSGSLVSAKGKPVQGARVRAFAGPIDSGADSPEGAIVIDSALTDASGTYRFDALGNGEYSLIGDYQDGSLVALVGEVSYQISDPVYLGEDTLRAPGKIRGMVSSHGQRPGGAFCYLPGTSFLAVADDSGFFEISKVPEGEYIVRFALRGFRKLSEAGVKVVAGRITSLGARLLEPDTAGRPPNPTGLEARYDSAGAVAKLHWHPSPAADLAGYLVFRDDGTGAAPRRVNAIPVKDTAYADSVLAIAEADSGSKTLMYRVKAVDNQANLSEEYSAPATVITAHPKWVATTLDFRFPWPNGQTMSIGDTMGIVLEYSNPTRRLLKVIWLQHLESVQSWDTVAVHPLSGLQGLDSVIWSSSEAGRHEILALVFDGVDSTAYMMSTFVDTDPPEVRLGEDTVVSIGDRIVLHGGVRDAFGSVRSLEWNIGGGAEFRATRSSDTSFLAPMRSDTQIVCILRALDDDGISAEDTLRVDVVADPPVAKLDVPAEAIAGDSLTLSGKGSKDRFGSIVKWEWDIGGTGNFVPAPGPRYRIPVPAAAGTGFRCALRVTDDDGQTDTAQAQIAIRARGDWILATHSAPFGGAEQLKGQGVFRNRFWMLGLVRDVQGYQYRFWHTADMVVWDSLTPQLPIEGAFIDGASILEMGDEMWIVATNEQQSTDGIRQGGGSVILASRDGVSWRKVPNSDLRPEYPVTLAFKDRIWSIAGSRDNTILGEVWSHPSSGPWTQVNSAMAPGPRVLPKVAVLDGAMWLFGGHVDNVPKYDVWRSMDGIAWIRTADSALTDGAEGASLLSCQGKLWALSQFTSRARSVRQVASSPDGKSWTRYQDTSANAPPLYGIMATFNGKIWQLGPIGEKDDAGSGEKGNGGNVWQAPYP